MSEKLYHSPEQSIGNIDLSQETEQNLQRISKEALEAESQKLELQELANAVEQKAVSSEDITVGEKEVPPTAATFGSYKDLKMDAYARTMKRVRGRLNGPERLLSRVVHQPAVDAVSNALSKTVARPSAILGAGTTALLGSSLLLYFAKRYGFTYNYLVFFILIAAGLIAGLLIEFVVRIVSRAQR